MGNFTGIYFFYQLISSLRAGTPSNVHKGMFLFRTVQVRHEYLVDQLVQVSVMLEI